MKTYDFFISGAGPAGSTISRQLAKQGFDVLLTDKESFPRNKLCGGGITPFVYKYLDIDISSVIEYRCKTGRFDFNHKKGSVYKVNSLFIDMVNRTNFDNFLLQKAIEQGTSFKPKIKTMGFTETDENIIINTNQEDFKAKYLIAADGHLSYISKQMGFKLKKKNIIFEVCIPFSKNASSEFKTTMVFDIGVIKGGYAWIFPKGSYASIGMGSYKEEPYNVKKLLEKYIEKNKYNFDLSNYKIKALPAPYFEETKTKRSSKKVILIGDAGFLTNPLTGEGIHNAFFSAKIAFNYIMQNKKSETIDFTGFHTILMNKMKKEQKRYIKVRNIFFSMPYFWFKLILEKNIIKAQKFLDPTTFK